MAELVHSRQRQNLPRQRQNLLQAALPSPVELTSKRIIDFILAFTGIILLAPLLLLCALACRLSSNGPALFRHQRVGFRGKSFECFKFRTMVANSEDYLREYLESNPKANAEWAAT